MDSFLYALLFGYLLGLVAVVSSMRKFFKTNRIAEARIFLFVAIICVVQIAVIGQRTLEVEIFREVAYSVRQVTSSLMATNAVVEVMADGIVDLSVDIPTIAGELELEGSEDIPEHPWDMAKDHNAEQIESTLEDANRHVKETIDAAKTALATSDQGENVSREILQKLDRGTISDITYRNIGALLRDFLIIVGGFMIRGYLLAKAKGTLHLEATGDLE